MSEPVILSLTQGGAELGDRLSARLGWPHLDRAALGADVPGAFFCANSLHGLISP
ncbi:hypothetical protein [Mangrovicoccus ximenensis]|uniref:hypothetical protein n=1 Tax=Mangrovicoccus ximenensis TaxID=1911570 RepID=UPI001374B812|nr:hypothetical protein [Mangrovicoccus ximenensis]